MRQLIISFLETTKSHTLCCAVFVELDQTSSSEFWCNSSTAFLAMDPLLVVFYKPSLTCVQTQENWVFLFTSVWTHSHPPSPQIRVTWSMSTAVYCALISLFRIIITSIKLDLPDYWLSRKLHLLYTDKFVKIQWNNIRFITLTKY